MLSWMPTAGGASSQRSISRFWLRIAAGSARRMS
jgi:hypothetical protein